MMIIRVLLISLCWSTAYGDDLSRLFTTPQQRHALNNPEVKPIKAAIEPLKAIEIITDPVASKSQLNGFVTVNGKTTAWINGEIKPNQSLLNGEILLNQGKQTIKLRPGQVFDANTLQVKEVFSDSQP